MDHWVG